MKIKALFSIPPFLPVAFLALFFSTPLRAAELFTTKMVEAEPVEQNGLQFVAATEAKWVCFNPPLGEDPIQIQLLIRNVGKQPLLFSTFDTFGLSLKDAAGKMIQPHGGRDGTLRVKPVTIDAGASCCLARQATLRWNSDGKTRTLSYFDGTGSVATFGPLPAGSFTLSFWCVRSPADALLPQEGIAMRSPIPEWFGKIATNEVPFEIVDP
jgi:hypothetical protein